MTEKDDKFSGLNQPTTNLERFKQGFKGLLTEITQFQRIWLNDPRNPITTAEGIVAKTLESEFWRRLMVRTFEALRDGCTTDQILDTVEAAFEEVLGEVENKDMSERTEHGHPELKPLITSPDKKKDLPSLFERGLLKELGEETSATKDRAPTLKMAKLGEEHQNALDVLRQTLKMRFIPFIPELSKDLASIQDTRRGKAVKPPKKG